MKQFVDQSISNFKRIRSMNERMKYSSHKIPKQDTNLFWLRVGDLIRSQLNYTLKDFILRSCMKNAYEFAYTIKLKGELVEQYLVHLKKH